MVPCHEYSESQEQGQKVISFLYGPVLHFRTVGRPFVPHLRGPKNKVKVVHHDQLKPYHSCDWDDICSSTQAWMTNSRAFLQVPPFSCYRPSLQPSSCWFFSTQCPQCSRVGCAIKADPLRDIDTERNGSNVLKCLVVLEIVVLWSFDATFLAARDVL